VRCGIFFILEKVIRNHGDQAFVRLRLYAGQPVNTAFASNYPWQRKAKI
jgi:hypothetical protein